MFGLGYSRLFHSRWTALIWAALILWGAYEFVGDASQDDNATANADGGSEALDAL